MLKKLAIRATMLAKGEFAEVPTAAPAWGECEIAKPFRCIPEHVGRRAVDAAKRLDTSVLADPLFWFTPDTWRRVVAAFGGEQPDIVLGLSTRIGPDHRSLENWPDPEAVEIVLVVAKFDGIRRTTHPAAIWFPPEGGR